MRLTRSFHDPQSPVMTKNYLVINTKVRQFVSHLADNLTTTRIQTLDCNFDLCRPDNDGDICQQPCRPGVPGDTVDSDSCPPQGSWAPNELQPDPPSANACLRLPAQS